MESLFEFIKLSRKKLKRSVNTLDSLQKVLSSKKLTELEKANKLNEVQSDLRALEDIVKEVVNLTLPCNNNDSASDDNDKKTSKCNNDESYKDRIIETDKSDTKCNGNMYIVLKDFLAGNKDIESTSGTYNYDVNVENLSIAVEPLKVKDCWVLLCDISLYNPDLKFEDTKVYYDHLEIELNRLCEINGDVITKPVKNGSFKQSSKKDKEKSDHYSNDSDVEIVSIKYSSNKDDDCGSVYTYESSDLLEGSDKNVEKKLVKRKKLLNSTLIKRKSLRKGSRMKLKGTKENSQTKKLSHNHTHSIRTKKTGENESSVISIESDETDVDNNSDMEKEKDRKIKATNKGKTVKEVSLKEYQKKRAVHNKRYNDEKRKLSSSSTISEPDDKRTISQSKRRRKASPDYEKEFLKNTESESDDNISKDRRPSRSSRVSEIGKMINRNFVKKTKRESLSNERRKTSKSNHQRKSRKEKRKYASSSSESNVASTSSNDKETSKLKRHRKTSPDYEKEFVKNTEFESDDNTSKDRRSSRSSRVSEIGKMISKNFVKITKRESLSNERKRTAKSNHPRKSNDERRKYASSSSESNVASTSSNDKETTLRSRKRDSSSDDKNDEKSTRISESNRESDGEISKSRQIPRYSRISGASKVHNLVKISEGESSSKEKNAEESSDNYEKSKVKKGKEGKSNRRNESANDMVDISKIRRSIRFKEQHSKQAESSNNKRKLRSANSGNNDGDQLSPKIKKPKYVFSDDESSNESVILLSGIRPLESSLIDENVKSKGPESAERKEEFQKEEDMRTEIKYLTNSEEKLTECLEKLTERSKSSDSNKSIEVRSENVDEAKDKETVTIEKTKSAYSTEKSGIMENR